MINTNINTGVTGTFYFKDPVTGEVQHEIKNKISDWGMKRLAGHCRHELWAFAENFCYLFFGTSQGASMTSNHGLVNIMPDRSISPTAKFEIRHKGNNQTKTTSYYDSADNLVIEFHQTFTVYFYSETIIKEIGIGPSAGANVSVPAAPNNIDQDGNPLFRSGFLGGSSRGYQLYGGLSYVDGARSTHLPDNNIAIFSRAAIPGVLGVKYNANQETEVTYKCTLTISKDVSTVKDNFRLDVTGVATPSPSNQLSNNKTIIRTFPFYPLNSSRLPSGGFQGLRNPGSGTWDSQFSIWKFYERDSEICPPFFENLPYDSRYSSQPTGIAPDGVNGGVWLLDFYTSPSVNSTYSTFTNTITAPTNTLRDSSNTLIPLPINSEKIHTTTSNRAGTTFIPRNDPIAGPGAGRVTDFEFWEQISDREPQSIEYTQTGNTWQTKLSFQVSTDHLNRAGGVSAFTLWRAVSPNQQMKEELRGYGGLTTVLENPYVPQVGKILTINYTFTWTRI